MVGMKTWVDYTGEQNFTIAGTVKQVSKPAPGTPHAAWKGKAAPDNLIVQWSEYEGNIPKLLRLCKQRGIDPPFVRFKDNPNYYKLLTDRRLYDAKGNLVKQKVVEPNFDMKAIEDVLANYRKADDTPVAEVVAMFAKNPPKMPE
jgi:hypothetical protein